MGVVLLILKIAGIVLLVLLGLLIYAILAPFYLKASGGKEAPAPGQKERLFLTASVRSLLRFWHVDVDIDGDARNVVLSALWGRVQLLPKKKETQDFGRDLQPDSETKEARAAFVESTDPKPQSGTDAGSGDAKEPDTAGEGGPKTKETQTANDRIPRRSEAKKSGGEEKEKSGHTKKLLVEMLSDGGTWRAVGRILKCIAAIPRWMRFHLGGTDLVFSLSDPRYTGYLAGLLLMLPSYYEEDVRFVPDFAREDPYLEGHVRVNAHLSPAMLLWTLIRILADKNCRTLLKRGMKLVKG